TAVRRLFPAAPADVVPPMPAAMREIVPRHLVFVRAVRVMPDDHRPIRSVSRGEEETAAAPIVLRMGGSGAVKEEEVERLALPSNRVLLHDARSGRTHFVQAEIHSIEPRRIRKSLLQTRHPVRE